ncbi:adventurous gliding motility protein GltG [Hyalangium minutum]|uniref:FHA domain containing protein n=1 Tax=Hyalangium minutum TaxID=394096 RepID=A0A085WHC8_9BACT|nr:adventurous gliding motility protein GltG [Hyalangium minutum]KFE67091.1 FHA domain containing protein [Hyalangium minutum]
MAVPLTLKVFKGETLVTSKDFERDIIKIGRLSSAHLCLEDEKVSRIHSVIEVGADGSLSIIDMGSVEGTYVNGKRVNKGKVAFGDEIKVGGTTIRLESPAAVAAVNLAAAVSSSDVTTRVEVPVADMQAASQHLAQAAAAPVAAPQVVAAPAPVPVAAPAPAIDSSFASTEQNAVVAPVAEAPVEEEAPRARAARKSSKASGPLGASVGFRWGDQRVGEYFLPSGKAALHWNESLMLALFPKGLRNIAGKSLVEQLPESRDTVTVGTASGVDIAMSDAKLSSPKMAVLKKHSDLHTFSVSFTGKMKGELVRKGETLDLNAVIESGKATSDGGAYSLVLEHDDFFWADLGGITMEVQFQPAPKRVYVPLADSVDYRVLNIFLLTFFLGTMFVIGAMNRSGADEEFADELSGDNSRLAKLIIKPPETQKNKFLEQLNQQKEKQKAGEKAAKQKKEEGQMGKKEAPKTQNRTAPQAQQRDKKDEARALTAKIFGGSKGGVSTLFGNAGLGGELKSAMGNMFGAKAGDSGGFGGLGIRGGGGGGGGTGDTIGIGAIGTKGRGGGTASYGSGVGVLGGKQSVDVGITSSEPVVMGSLDKELIRQVIQRNRGQIRFCYESQLTKYPKLNGKVAVKFVINAEGAVVSSSVAQSTAGNAELETCVAGRVRTWMFPKPKGGGVVVVTYPFIFKASGE